jgi:Zn-finger nucleic acid-binding protein
MVILELDQVEVDHCLECKGVWLDAGELELLIEMSGAEGGALSRAIEAGGRKPAGEKRRCPVCRKKMLAVDVEGPPLVTVDRCRYGHGLWLDDRELGQLLESVGGSPETEALARLCGRLLRSERSRPQDGEDDVGTDPVE